MIRNFRIAISVLVSSVLLGCGPSADAKAANSEEQLLAREPLQNVSVHLAGTGPHRLVVKFKDGLRARPQGSSLRMAQTEASERVNAVAQAHQLTFRPLLDLQDGVLDTLERRAASLSRRQQPDLRGIVVAEQPEASNEWLLNVARLFDAMDETEYVYLEPLENEPPGDIAPTTPSFVSRQTHFDSTVGLDVDGAWAANAKGQGVRLSDCEYGWNTAHEDLDGADIHPEPGQTPDDEIAIRQWDQHGTAVVGVTSGLVNDYGINGIVPEAEIHTFSEWTLEGGQRRASAIAAAIAQSRPGDVVLLEMQVQGPTGEYVPAEYDPTVFSIVKNGVDQGVIVVAAAGNGGQDLDSSLFASYRNRGNSGAIIVGAGTSSQSHDRLLFSTYGSRVDVQGWGQNVMTTGYGGVAMLGNDINQSYTLFSGTSSASPLVASAVAAIQSYAKDNLSRVIGPTEMKTLLKSTGIAQGTAVAGNIGPLPNIRAAIAALGGVSSQGPAVTVIKPALNAVVTGVIEILASATDVDGSIAKVVFTLPDNSIQEVSSDPYLVSWDTRKVANGSHFIRVEAIDDSGQKGNTETVILINNQTATNCINGTFDASGLPLSVPDNNSVGVSSSIQIDGDGKVSSLALSLNMKHTYRGDLVVLLRAPSGESWVAHDRTGGSADDLVLNAVSVPSFAGVTAAGAWTLHVSDNAQVDLGTIESWSLQINASCE